MPNIFQRDTELQDNIEVLRSVMAQINADKKDEKMVELETFVKKNQLEIAREEAKIANINAIANLTRAFTDAGGVMTEIDKEAIKGYLGGMVGFDIGKPKAEQDLEKALKLEEIKTAGELKKIRARGVIEKEIQGQRDTATDKRARERLAVETAKEGLTPADLKGGQEAVSELASTATVRTGETLASGKLSFWKKYNISTNDVINLVGSEAFSKVHPELGKTLDAAFIDLDEALNTYENEKDKNEVLNRFIAAYPELKTLFKR